MRCGRRSLPIKRHTIPDDVFDGDDPDNRSGRSTGSALTVRFNAD